MMDTIGQIHMLCLCVLGKSYIMGVIGLYSVSFAHVLFSFFNNFVKFSCI